MDQPGFNPRGIPTDFVDFGSLHRCGCSVEPPPRHAGGDSDPGFSAIHQTDRTYRSGAPSSRAPFVESTCTSWMPGPAGSAKVQTTFLSRVTSRSFVRSAPIA